MTVVASNCARKENDPHPTVPWATEVLLRRLSVDGKRICETAVGNHLMRGSRVTSYLPNLMVRLGGHATAGFNAVNPRHYRCRILPYLGALGEALKRIACDLEGLVPVERITTCFPSSLMHDVLFDFRPFFKEIDGVFQSGNLTSDVVPVLHKNRTVKQFGVHHILQVGERLVFNLQPFSATANQKSVFAFPFLQEAEGKFSELGGAA